MLIIARALAQMVDIIVYFIILALLGVVAVPFIQSIFGNDVVTMLIYFILSIIVTLMLQYPFLKNNQTIGKAFFGLGIESTDPDVEITPTLILQRDILIKLASCYICCLPMLFGKRGWHEDGTSTKVVFKSRGGKNKND